MRAQTHKYLRQTINKGAFTVLFFNVYERICFFFSNEIRLPIGVQYDPQIGVLFTLIWFFVFGILNLIRQFEEHIVNFNEITLLSIHICFSHFFAVCLFFVPLLCFFVRIICVMPFGAQIVDEMFIDST